jgi:Bacterial regulatory proteins, tetR family
MAARSETLLKRKQQLVRDAIWDAAIGLFAKHGFEEVTVDDIAEAAGVSPRSFFLFIEERPPRPSSLLLRPIHRRGNRGLPKIMAAPRSHETCNSGHRSVRRIQSAYTSDHAHWRK